MRPASIPHTPPRGVLHGHLPPDDLLVLSTLCVWQGLAMLFCVGFFAFLPISRRRAKVRWAHLVRIGAYSLALLVLPPIAVLLGAFVIGVFAALFTPILLFVWWWQATARYLRMPHAVVVALAAVVMAALAAALAVGLVGAALGL